jgi:hypothetical protein
MGARRDKEVLVREIIIGILTGHADNLKYKMSFDGGFILSYRVDERLSVLAQTENILLIEGWS